MSVPVELTGLAKHIEAFGPVAFFVTAGEDAAPHVVSVAPAWQGEELVVVSGSRTGRNVDAHGRATLLWPPASGGEYCLIVDGNARVEDGCVALRPTRAVLHRMQSADESLPSCVTVL